MNASNPVTWGSAVLGVATAALGLLTQFGVHLTADQSGAIMTFLGAIILASGFVLHNKVISKGDANAKIDQAWVAPPDAPTELKPKA